MTERAEIAKLQKRAADLAALASFINTASEMAALSGELLTKADQITEITGELAERLGFSVAEVFEHLEDQ